MALEKRDGTQIVSLAPPLPIRAFAIVGSGSTTEAADWGGSGTDGTRYGYVTVNTTQWDNTREILHQPPITPGEQFQVWQPTAGGGAQFPQMPSFYVASTGARSVVSSPLEGAAPDTFDVNSMALKLSYGNVFTVVGTQQTTATNFNVYFSPFNATVMNAIINGINGIVTIPAPSNPRWIGRIGHVADVNYTYSVPGGPDQLTFNIQVEPDFRDVALNPGRIIQCFRGGECIWEGELTEPTPSTTGWACTANGVGTYGSNYTAYFGTWNADDAINKAIERGLRWKNPGIGDPAGIYLGPEQDPGSLLITDFLNLLCTGGALQWMLMPSAGSTSVPAGPWTLTVTSMQTDLSGNPLVLGATAANNWNPGDWHRTDTLKSQARQPPDLYLVNTSPVARTIAADYNTMVLRYQISGDSTATSTDTAVTAQYGVIVVDSPGSVQLHGRMEYYLDLSNGGTMTEAQVIAVGQNILSKYVRANFSNSFTVQPGQLLNSGGVPVDLGCNWGGKICTVQNINSPNGGEVSLEPITFIIGTYEYDDDSQTATVTPYQAAQTDMASIISMLYPAQFA